MTTAPEAHENSAPCQREVLRARGHLERVHAGQARRVRHEAVVQVDICVQTPPPCRCSCTAVHCHATLKCLAQGMQAACKAEARACVLHAAQRDLVLDLLRAQPLGALAHDEAVDLHAGKKGSARVSGFFFFFSCCYPQHAARGTLPQVRRTASKPAPPRRIQCAAALQRPHLVGARIARPDADHVREGGVADPALPRVQDPAAVHLRAPAAVAGQGGARIMRMHLT